MKFKLKAYSIWEQGHYRGNQEDSIYPAYGEITDNDRLFILCDGMGGHDHGEVASAAVCEAMSKYVNAYANEDGEFSDEILKGAVTAGLDALDEKDTGAEKKMGTTMTFLKFHKDGVTIAHIGDSRVYHIRPGNNAEDTQILFQTRDHSLVNDLIKIGELTEEEAKTSKQKNVITRAMQPKMERRPKADIMHVEDVRPGDYFFMCSDGMLDQMENNNLKFIFSKPKTSDRDKIEMLKGASDDSHDNHSAHIIHVIDVIVEKKPVDISSNISESYTNVRNLVEPDATPRWSKKKIALVSLITIVLLAIISAAYRYFFTGDDTQCKPEQAEVNEGGQKKAKRAATNSANPSTKPAEDEHGEDEDVEAGDNGDAANPEAQAPESNNNASSVQPDNSGPETKPADKPKNDPVKDALNMASKK